MNDTDEVKKAKKYIGAALPVFLWETDWSEPSADDLKSLLSFAENMDKSGLNNEELDQLDSFIEFRGSSEELLDEFYLDDIVKICQRKPIHSMCNVEKEHVVKVGISSGGPGLDLEFRLNGHGELRYAQAVYRECGSQHVETLDTDVAEGLWSQFSSLGEEIAMQERENEGRGPGY